MIMKMTKECRQYGRTYPDEAAFCGKCGLPLYAIEEPKVDSISKKHGKAQNPRNL